MLAVEQIAELTKFRQWLHQHPEIAFKEFKTGTYIRDFLYARGVQESDIKTFAVTGFTVDIKGKGPESATPKCIAIRADLDGLPMEEHNLHLEYRSVNHMAAHMCGHDGHITCLTGFAWYVLDHIDSFPSNCTLRLLYQPAEESPGGAKPMIDEGCLEGVDEVYGYHNTPLLDLGQLFCPDAAVMAHPCFFTVTVKGKGGHGAYPQLNIDSLLAASTMVTSLQSIISRNLSCHEKAVLSVCEFHSGSAPNVMPEEAVFTGTIRNFEEGTLKTIKKRFKEVCNGVAQAMRCKVNIQIQEMYPAVINHATNAGYVRDAATRTFGEDIVIDMEPSAGAEDFSYFLQERPGAFFFMGTGFKHMVWHEPNYNYNDDLTPHVVQQYAALMEDRMGFKFL